MVVLLLLPMGARAQVQTDHSLKVKEMQRIHPSFITSDGKVLDEDNCEVQRIGGTTLYKQMEKAIAPRKAEAGDVTVTFNLEYDEDVFYPMDYDSFILNNESHEEFWPTTMEAHELSASIPKGNYELAIIFYKNGLSPYVVIKEQVEVQEDMTLTFNPDMAINYLEVINYNPNGERCKADLGYFDKDLRDWVITDEGNVYGTTVNNYLYLKGYKRSLLSNRMLVFGIVQTEEDRFMSTNDCHVNDVSDRYLFTQSRSSTFGLGETNEFYICKFSTDDVKAGIMENNPNDYVLCEEEFLITPEGKDIIGMETYVSDMWIYNNTLDGGTGWNTLYNKMERKNDVFPIKIYVNSTFEDAIDNRLNMLVCAQASCGSNDNLMAGSPFSIVNGKKVYVNVQEGSKSTLYANLANDFAFPGRPEFTYPATMKAGTYGDNCPINAFTVMNYYASWMGQNVTSFANVYVGRYSETRWCDIPRGNMKFNGEVIENPNEWQAEEEGVYDITMVNTNIEVDGLQGKNKTIVHYDMTQEDNTPPTIEMLQFKNADGVITDRFEKAEDGRMVFTAADINYFLDSETWASGFDYQPLSVTVEYAPYDKDDWTEMQIEEVPELYNEDGWGYYYQTSLKDVEGAGEKGWFDLRFTMADAAGNTHVQTVSPAFRIDDKVDTGIGGNNQYTITNNNEVYDLMGRKVGNGSRLLDNGYCNKGISIVRRANGDVRKVVIK